MEWRCVGASTSRGINSFGLQIRLRTVSFDQLRERLSRNERSKIRKEQKRGQQLVSAPFRSKFHFSPRFSPSVSRFPFPVRRLVDRDPDVKIPRLPSSNSIHDTILFRNNKPVFTRGRRATNDSRRKRRDRDKNESLSYRGDRLSMQLVIGRTRLELVNRDRRGLDRWSGVLAVAASRRRISKKGDFKSKIDKINETQEDRCWRILIDLSIYLGLDEFHGKIRFLEIRSLLGKLFWRRDFSLVFRWRRIDSNIIRYYYWRFSP